MLKKLRGRFSQLSRGEFVRNVGVLVGGTAFAQALMILILPLLTRLYSPADFAILAVYTSIHAILAGVACLRFEIAIPIPENNEEAAKLLLLALTSATVFSAIIALITWLYSVQIADLTGYPAFELYIWLLPLGVWLSGVYAALQYWAARHKNFNLIAKTRLSQASGGAAVQLSFGWLGLTPIGLLLGQLMSSGAGVVGLSIDAWRQHLKEQPFVRPKSILATFRRYDRFPKYSTLEALANGASIQFPVLMIAALAVGPEVGFLILATRITAAPMGLIGNAVSQVFLAHAADERLAGRLDSFTSKIIGGLIKLGVGPLICIGAVSPFAFPLFFGAEWSRAGEIVSWMTPGLIFQFLASPVSMLLHVTGNQRSAFVLQLIGLFVRVGFVAIVALFSPLYVVEAYAISGLVFYLVYLAVVFRTAGLTFKNLTTLFINSWKALLVWLIISGASTWFFVFAQEYLNKINLT